MPSWPVFDAILVVWPFSEPFACGGVAISEPFACGGVAISETFACLGTCGPMHGLFFSCGSVVLSMWRCPWKLYIDVAFSLHNRASYSRAASPAGCRVEWTSAYRATVRSRYLVMVDNACTCSTEPRPLHCSRAATPS